VILWIHELVAALTDRRVGTKIMIAVLVVAFFSVFDGLWALDSLGATNRQVKVVYRHSQELDAIGALHSAVNQTWLAADDYLLSADGTSRGSAATALTAARAEVDRDAATYRGYPLSSAAAGDIASFDIHGVTTAAQQVTDGATETSTTAAELATTAAELRTTVAAFRI
jgi:methyl-accepting chemotaxis protein